MFESHAAHERREGLPRPMFERFQKWGRISAMIGVLFVNPSSATAGPFRSHYPAYQEANRPNPTEAITIASQEREIVKIYGEEVLDLIQNYDQIAFFERREQHAPPVIFGIEHAGLEKPDILQEWSEERGALPQKWLNGEVDEIHFSDKDGEFYEARGISGALEGSFQHEVIPMREAPTQHNQSIILFTGKASHLSAEEKKALLPFYRETFLHETGHANDWVNNMSLKLSERYDLLLAVHKQLSSDQRYRDPQVQTMQYYESFIDGTPQGAFSAAQEYWAEIVMKYFTDPEWLHVRHPNDFTLVDQHVKMKDPDFNVFKK